MSPAYELYAVSYHIGTPRGGHYTAMCKIDDKWYEFNDDSSTGPYDNIIGRYKKKGYCYFYKRISTEGDASSASS